jgi:uncharacterized membrane protein
MGSLPKTPEKKTALETKSADDALEVWNKLPEQERALIISKIEMEHYSGPIPSASELEKYERILPGAADRIMTQAEKEGEFRRAFVASKLNKFHTSNITGMVFAFTLSIGFAAAAVYCASLGQTAVAVAFGCVPIGQVAAHFLKSR